MFGFGKKKKAKPPAVENELGNFQMAYYGKDPMYIYQGDVDWQGSKDASAWVHCDDRETFSAEKGFKKLAEVLECAAEWDARLRKYALEFAVEAYGTEDGLIEIWGSDDPEDEDEDDAPVTQEEFARRISVVSVTIRANGDLEFDVDLDDMFTDHCLLVYADKDGNLSDSGLMG